MSDLKHMRFRRELYPWCYAALVCLMAILARTYLIQPPSIAHGCEEQLAWWCLIRLGIIYTYAFHTIGQLAVVLALASIVVPRIWLAACALAVGFAALVLYCYEPGALAIVLSAVMLARLQSAASGGSPPRPDNHLA